MDIPTDFDDFQSSISLSMIKSVDDHRHFLPESKLAELVTKDRIRSEVGDAPSLVDFIARDAKRIFALVVFLGITRNAEELHSVMEDFRRNGFDDSLIPVTVSIGLGITGHPGENGEEGYRTCKAARHTSCNHDDLLHLNAFHHKLWSPGKIKRFYTDQWQFRAPVFKKGKLKHRLFPDDVLPFTELSSSPRDGSFSKVSRVKIHKDHQKVLCEVKDHEPSFAIKELKELPWPGYKPENAWAVEADSLDQIGMLNNEHLIKPIAAYTRRNKYCFIFEWAEGGTLRDYWHANPIPELSPNLIRTILEQLLGLARAIYALHHDGKHSDTKNGGTKNDGTNNDGTNNDGTNNDGANNDCTIMEDDNTERNWRHGDLKPDNILRFFDHSDDQSQLGMLRIADLGLAKRHKFRTTARDNPTDTKFGTSQYEPPEAFTQPRKARSRLYDIWSMGCIIFELTVWLLYGSPGLEKFLNEDCVDTPQSNLFFVCVNMLYQPEARLNDNGVRKWMSLILPQDPECRETQECDDHEDCKDDGHAKLGTAIGDLLRLVRTQLLVINLPEPDNIKGTPHRGDANVLVDELDKILRRAQKKDSYALSVARRSGMKPPEPMESRPEPTKSQPRPNQSNQNLLSPHDNRIMPQKSAHPVPERSFQKKKGSHRSQTKRL